MATTIKLKNGSGAPLAGDLVQGEPAFDLTNKRLYTEDSGGSVIEVGTNPTSLTTGTFTSTGIDDNATSTAITIDSSENVGIGTASPSEPLSVAGNVTINSALYRTDTGAGGIRFSTAGNIRPVNTAGTSTDLALDIGDPSFRFNDLHLGGDAAIAGNVGIGTASPNTSLDVVRAGVQPLRLQSTSGTEVAINMVNTGGNVQLEAHSGNFTIDADNVGIGTTSPTGALTISKASSDNAINLIRTGSNTANAWIWANSNKIRFGDDSSGNPNNTRMAIDVSTGNVGIGTSSPEVLTHLKSSDNTIFEIESTTATAYMKMVDSNTTGAGYIGYVTNDMTFWANNAERMRINSNGDLLVRNTSGGDFQTSGRGLVVIDGTSDCAVEMKAGGTTYGYMYTSAAEFRAGNYTANPFTFYTNNTERMRIDSSGNVGIGTTSPTVPLTVQANSSASAVRFFGRSSDNISTLGFIANDGVTGQGYVQGRSDSLRVWAASGDYLSLGSSDTERMRILSTGDVGYSGKLFSSNVTSATGGLQLYRDHATGSCYLFDTTPAPFSGPLIFGTTNTERMRIDASGNVLVGTTISGTPTNGIVLYKDSNRGILKAATTLSTADAVASFYNPNGKVGQIITNGSTTAYQTSSDQRLKENIVDAPSASGDIDAIQVRSFDWKIDGAHQKYGMIAQELQSISPEAVSAQSDPEEMLGVDYSKLVPMMIKEIQDLRARVAQLEGE